MPGLAEKSTEDGAATLTMLTAATVARIVEVLPRAPQSWIVAGGGARNPTLIRMLAERLAPAARRDRGSGRLVGRRARGAGLRVSRRALAERPAAHVSDHDRRAAADDGRCTGQAVSAITPRCCRRA